jgi:hypothetical protein
MVDVILKPVGVVHGNRGTGIVANHVPFFDFVFHTNLLNLFGEHFQLVRSIRDLRSPAESRQINRKTCEAIAQPVDDAAPQPAVGGHAVYEQDGIS